MPLLTDLTTIPPVRALLAGAARAPCATRSTPRIDLAGYCAPVNGLGWGVVVEQPTAAALASVKAGRERPSSCSRPSSVARPSAVMVAAAVGWPGRSGRWRALIEQLSAGNPGAIAPARADRVQRLARGFGDLRDRLAARTAERERAEARLRFVADASRQLAGSLDYTETLGSVARQAVPVPGRLHDRRSRGRAGPGAARGDRPRRPGARGPRRRAAALSTRPHPDAAPRIARVIRAGTSDLRPVITDDYLAEIALDADHLAILRSPRPRASSSRSSPASARSAR